MTTRDIPCLTIDQFLGVVVKYSFKKTLKFIDCKKFKISMIQEQFLIKFLCLQNLLYQDQVSSASKVMSCAFYFPTETWDILFPFRYNEKIMLQRVLCTFLGCYHIFLSTFHQHALFASVVFLFFIHSPSTRVSTCTLSACHDISVCKCL